MGVWEYYGYTASKEKVLQRYDHSTKELIYYWLSGDMTYRAENRPGQWASRVVDRPPLYVGGGPALAAYTTQLQYPQQAQARNIQGQVVIGFAIDTLGQAAASDAAQHRRRLQPGGPARGSHHSQRMDTGPHRHPCCARRV
ncbi:hypothetical protein [Hymenobacter sp. B1770]|uniref:hypothetical protein n=1 Tax=Hymenobacter sp. B1770 TaxID=1718788 RepID=UPI003CE7057D